MTCRKIPYKTAAEAARAAAIMARKRKTGAYLSVYRCGQCGSYHWGHQFSFTSDSGDG